MSEKTCPNRPFLQKVCGISFQSAYSTEGEIVSFFTPETFFQGFGIQTVAETVGLYARNTILNCKIYYFWLSANCWHCLTSETSSGTGLFWKC